MSNIYWNKLYWDARINGQAGDTIKSQSLRPYYGNENGFNFYNINHCDTEIMEGYCKDWMIVKSVRGTSTELHHGQVYLNKFKIVWRGADGREFFKQLGTKKTKIWLKQNGMILEELPEDMRTVELCKIAVNNDWRALKYVPTQLKSLEMCLNSLRKDGRAIAYIPNELITTELCVMAIKWHDYYEYIPENKITRRVCSALARANWEVIKHIPDEFKTIWMKKLYEKKSTQAYKIYKMYRCH